MNDPNVRLNQSAARPIGPDAAGRDTYADRACARVELDQARQEGQVAVARGALRMIVETTEYVSDRSTHLSSNVAEGMKAAETLGAVSRQIRMLSGNTSLEASRLGGNATVAEIARQMRLLSQQVSALSEHLLTCLRSQGVALGELSGAIDAILADATSTQAILERGRTADYDGPITPLLGLLQSVPESAAAMERPADG
jgi:sirohydrochlorin ferrochelatase